MSRAPSTDLEHSNEIPTWIVLVGAGLALVVFFGWILKDLSIIVSPIEGDGVLVQPLSETRPASDRALDDASSAIELDGSQATSLVSSSLKSDRGSAVLKVTSSPDSMKNSTAHPVSRVAGQTGIVAPESGQSPVGQFARQKTAERTSDQQHASEFLATERDRHREIAEERESIAYAGTSRSRPAQFHPNTSSEVGSDVILKKTPRKEKDQGAGLNNMERIKVPVSESARIVARQESVVSEQEFSATEARSTKKLPVQSTAVVTPPHTAVQTNRATKNPGDTTPSHAQRPSADFEALRELLVEAAAIDEAQDGSVRAERERREAMESLNILSAAIRFIPGSKVTSDTMTSTLNQIVRILADYPEMDINVIVATNETSSVKRDMLLSQERGRALIARLVNGGLAFSRFSLRAMIDNQLPANSHRVEVQAHSKS